MKPGEYIPVFKNDVNGNLKLFNVMDTKYNGYKRGRTSREYINDKENDNIDFYMVYLLKDGLYEIKINNPNVFSFIDAEGQNNKFKVFKMDDIKKNFKVCKDKTVDSKTNKITRHQCIWIPMYMLKKI
jgi:GTP-binding protein EngB required for normal cell division